MSTQPEALDLADWLDSVSDGISGRKAASELRRLHAINAELVEALKAEKALRIIGQQPDVHWESLRDMRRSVYAATDEAIFKAEGREA